MVAATGSLSAETQETPQRRSGLLGMGVARGAGWSLSLLVPPQLPCLAKKGPEGAGSPSTEEREFFQKESVTLGKRGPEERRKEAPCPLVQPGFPHEPEISLR